MKRMRSFCYVATFGMVIVASAAQANFLVTASSNFQIFTNPNSSAFQIDGNTVDPGTIIAGGAGAGSGLNTTSNSETGSYGVAVSVVQDYALFRGGSHPERQST